MIERFQGENNKHNLVDALLAQFCINNDGVVASLIEEKISLQEFNPGDILIKQDGQDNDMYFILAGMVAIEINDREVARRGAGFHVGEMALIDVAAKRSATVKAVDVTVTARIAEQDFSEAASRHPVLWRRLALTLGQRLRERGGLVRPRNETPRVFIGSSVEGLEIARAIQTGLRYDPFVVQVWTDDVFLASKTSIENLVSIAETADFGVLILGADDKIESRDNLFSGPRDNVIFELGLFVGAVGRERSLLVLEQGSQIKIPTDLLGTTPINYQKGKAEDLAARVASTCSDIRAHMKKLGAK